MTSPECTFSYPHASVWCDACWADEKRSQSISLQEQQVGELKRQNNLKEEELSLEYWGYRRQRRQAPSLPTQASTPKPTGKGGIQNVQPRRPDIDQ